jgi:hypothetical protein
MSPRAVGLRAVEDAAALEGVDAVVVADVDGA